MLLILLGTLAVSVASLSAFAEPTTSDPTVSDPVVSRVYVKVGDKFLLGEHQKDLLINVLEGGYGRNQKINREDIYEMSGTSGPYKVGDQILVFHDPKLISVKLIGLNSQNLFLAEGDGAILPRRYQIDFKDMLPTVGSYNGIAIGQNFLAAVSSGQSSELKQLILRTFNSDQVFADAGYGDPISIKFEDIIKNEGCLGSGYLCVGHRYLNASTKESVTIVGISGSGWIHEKIEDGKFQGGFRIQNDETLVRLDPGVCSFNICTGETYLNAADNYTPVKVDGLYKERKVYYSSLDNPNQLNEFQYSPFSLMKENQKRTSLYGLNLGQKVVLIHGDDLVKTGHIVGIRTDNQFIVNSDLVLSDHPIASVAKAEGCDEKIKMCIGQKFSLHAQSGEDFLVKISGFQSNGLLVVSTTKNSYSNINPNSLTRKGCQHGICQEKDFRY